MGEPLRLTIASKGSYEEATLRFLESAGLSVWRPNPRQYVGRLSGIDGVEVLFQRTADIVHQVASGGADLGITGYDLVAELAGDDPNVLVVIDDLGFRRCELVLAVPESWLDITTISDLADLAVEWKRQGRTLRVATKFPNLTREFLLRNGVNYFTLVEGHGALEVAPALGYADLIADLTETGVTLRENRLRVLEGGVILRAQACLIACRRTLRQAPEKLERARLIIEMLEARLRSRRYRLITANVQGRDEDEVVRHVTAHVATTGELGPTVARVYPKSGDTRCGWYEVTIIVPAHLLMQAVDHLRLAGSTGITVTSPDYVFDSRSHAYERLRRALEEPV
ncbi:ATP phosphoribosyltransferase [Thermomicrobium sp. 4228-Ro]|uniref:ATP phosphoribosyltransferase n=1 Tax=Thermomicrobium sp. 4228-Ro TaxID=2993937 RepID=UPI002248A78F|nr:ATP phosphoribosyltransferase [Thermomicrobium sp. 4228-Ro]MCX2726246.1 ATP phosphoribosyltransferase [Thermomicrobium sp. 4228-Ro]